jgi:small subunit ribosomal protein S16
MATKIRLQRFGKKGKPFFHVVVADSRSPRDGKFIERLGSYNPNTNPATIEINFEKTLDWVTKGAEPTDTCRAILSYKGVLYRKHLDGGIKKGALTAEQAEAKFTQWLEAKGGKIEGKKEGLTSSKEEARKTEIVVLHWQLKMHLLKKLLKSLLLTKLQMLQMQLKLLLKEQLRKTTLNYLLSH